MKNVYKLLIVIISVVFMSSGVMAQMGNVAGNNDFNEDQLKLLKKSGLTERDLDTQNGIEQAKEVLDTYYYTVNNTAPQKSSSSSKPIKNPEETVTVTVGLESNTTTGTTGTNITPFGTWYEDGQNQYLYTAYELGIAGIGAGEITEIGWNVSEAAPDPMNGFNIEVKQTSALTAIEFETGFTNVYSGVYTADTGWNMFTFTEPFLYDGASSLLVKVCFDNPEYTANSHVYYSFTTDPMNAWAFNDGTAGCTDPYEGNMLERPNTRLTGEEMLNPPPGIPYNEMPLNGSMDVPIDGDVTWTFGNENETYDLWFGPAGNMELVVENELVTEPDGVYSYSGLNYASGHEWQVIVSNANGTTNGPVWGFATACGLVIPPYFEDFSTYTGTAPPPSCWDEADSGTPSTGPQDIGTSLWVSDNFGNVPGSSNCAKVNMYFTGKQEWLITPHVDLSGGGNNAAMFDIAVTNWNGTDSINMGSDDEVIFLISPDAGTSWDTLAIWDVTTPISNVGESVLIPLSGYTQSDVIFAFWANEGIVNDPEDYDFFLDNFSVIDASYGSLEGIVTDLGTSNPIEGAIVKLGYLKDTTDVSGMYSFPEALVGTQLVTSDAFAHNPASVEVTVIEDETTVQDIAMTAPTMEITPIEINVVINPFGTLTEYIDIANNGNGPLMWTAVLDTTGSGNDMWLTVTQFGGTVEFGETGQMQLDFDANTIVAGTVLNGTISFTSDPNVGEVIVPVTLTVGDLAFGHIMGNVLLDGVLPYNNGEITEVLVEAGPYYTNPDENGDYDLETYPGTYDITTTLYGYTQQILPDFVVEEGITTSDIDFTMPCILGKLYGNVTDIDTGDPIENASITAIDSPVVGFTDADGNYEMFVEAGTYAIQADHATYAVEVVQDIEIVSASDTEQDFALTYQCVFCDASGGGTEHITGVEFGSIVNLNNGYNTGYEDFTSMSTILIPGFTYDLTINIDPVYATDDYGVWIDWNFDCTFDPETENVLCAIDEGAASVTWAIDIPPTAQPGVATMRVRMKYSGADCGSPCGSTTFGEVEDYSVIITPGTYGSLSGIVSELSTGNPVEGAEVNVAGFYTDTTEADGSYFFEEVITGTWDLTTTKEGYNNSVQSVTIEEDVLTEQDVALTAPVLEFNPDNIAVTLEPNQQANESLVISNTGNGPVDWTANLSLVTDNSEEIGDIVWDLSIGNVTGETQTFGAEWDGIYFWSTGGNSFLDPNQLYQYDFDGNLVAQFDQPLDGSSSGIRDLAFDGTYLYGGNESAFYQIDPSDGTMTQLFENTFGQTITALAWVPVYNAFYSKNQGSDLIKFTMDGTLLETIPVTGADNVSGAAWDNTGNKLWLFNQSGSPQSTFLEYDIVANALTGVTQQVETVGGSSTQMSAGAFYATDMVPGFAVLGGSTQGSPNMAFAMDMGSSAAWINIDIESGTLGAGDDITMDVAIDATDLLPAVYEAEIIFTSDPNLGEIIVPVALTVEGLIPPVNLFAYFVCTDVFLSWDIPGGTPDSYNIYKNGVFFTNVTTLEYTDLLVDPMVEYCYTVTAVYGGDESQPSAESCLTVNMPGDLGLVIDGWPEAGNAVIVWDAPEGCVMPDEYSVYEDGTLLGTTADTFYVDMGLANGLYTYTATAVYYFGESEVSNAIPILIVSLDENNASELVVSPIPAVDYVKVNAGIHVSSYTLLDINGKIVESNIVESSDFTIDVSQYSEGLYYLRFETDEKPILRKIIIT